MFDSHCHLQLSQFDEDREAVLLRMRAGGLGAVVIGTDLATSREAVALAERHDFLWAAVGLHPNDNPSEEFDTAAFAELAQRPRVVGIGECGLDYFHTAPTNDERQAQHTPFPTINTAAPPTTTQTSSAIPQPMRMPTPIPIPVLTPEFFSVMAYTPDDFEDMASIVRPHS